MPGVTATKTASDLVPIDINNNRDVQEILGNAGRMRLVLGNAMKNAVQVVRTDCPCLRSGWQSKSHRWYEVQCN